MTPAFNDSSFRGAGRGGTRRGGLELHGEELIRGNADLDDRSERRVTLGVVIEGGETALMLAANANQPEIVKILIEAAPRVDLKNESGEDALAIAEKKGNTEVVTLLRDAVRGSSGSEQRLTAE